MPAGVEWTAELFEGVCTTVEPALEERYRASRIFMYALLSLIGVNKDLFPESALDPDNIQLDPGEMFGIYWVAKCWLCNMMKNLFELKSWWLAKNKTTGEPSGILNKAAFTAVEHDPATPHDQDVETRITYQKG